MVKSLVLVFFTSSMCFGAHKYKKIVDIDLTFNGILEQINVLKTFEGISIELQDKLRKSNPVNIRALGSLPFPKKFVSFKVNNEVGLLICFMNNGFFKTHEVSASRSLWLITYNIKSFDVYSVQNKGIVSAYKKNIFEDKQYITTDIFITRDEHFNKPRLIVENLAISKVYRFNEKLKNWY